MKTKTKNRLFILAWELNIVCACVVLFIVGFYWANEVIKSETLQPTIARAIEIVAPNLLDLLSGGSHINPTDFVHQHKQ